MSWQYIREFSKHLEVHALSLCSSVFEYSKIFSIVFEWLENIFECVRVTGKWFRVTRKCWVTWKCFRVTQKYVRVCSKRLANPDFQEVAGWRVQIIKRVSEVTCWVKRYPLWGRSGGSGSGQDGSLLLSEQKGRLMIFPILSYSLLIFTNLY